ncbi:alkaline phosphatase family protein [Luteitalea sp. TBR-22]|uniref:alkaline phosphatase family protein n=1 Tax=Luteitalea sp. TBR-22 TaxID=2802971 RepID=UPI001AF92BEA|nr:alkaline phosphatase family protein [Luteitalea sp. TBR-22]BCS34486.1 alkaline phosphatase family protein [Luteitalea sp. TBR-22]
MTTHLRRLLGAFLSCCTLALAASPAAAQETAPPPAPRPTRPKLVVVLVIDQFRGDYVDKYGHQWRHGLRRLFDEGAYYTEAAYRYASTMTCAGHATIGTGATPQIHGMISNVWYDRGVGHDVACTDDRTVTNVTYGALPARSGDSGAQMATPTLADEMRAQLGPSTRVVTFSMKARAAITLAGHRSTLSAWYDGARGFVSSPALNGPERHPFLASYLPAHPVERDANEVWTRLLPEQAYSYTDDGAGEAGTGALFPHRLSTPTGDGSIDPAFYANWQMSPFSDAFLGRMAAAAVTDMRLGRGPGTDFLAVSFSALDTVGHAYGPRSHEVQDVLARLDLTIGHLLESLDAQVGREHYALALTADHGVSPIPEQMRELGLGGGVVDRKAIATVLAASLGGSLLDSLTGSELYLSRDAASRLTTLDNRDWESLRSTLEQIPGISRVWRTSDLLAGRYEAESDPLAHAARLSAYPNRSGDLIYITDPYWFPYQITATHGTPYQYDQHVPMVFLGPQFRRGRYTATASPADVAPTLGRLVGVTLPAADGAVRADAFATPPGLPAPTATAGGAGTGHDEP